MQYHNSQLASSLLGPKIYEYFAMYISFHQSKRDFHVLTNITKNYYLIGRFLDFTDLESMPLQLDIALHKLYIIPPPLHFIKR
jgi:hypothetical protein